MFQQIHSKCKGLNSLRTQKTNPSKTLPVTFYLESSKSNHTAQSGFFLEQRNQMTGTTKMEPQKSKSGH